MVERLYLSERRRIMGVTDRAFTFARAGRYITI